MASVTVGWGAIHVNCRSLAWAGLVSKTSHVACSYSSLTTPTQRQIARDVELMTDLSSPVSSVRGGVLHEPVTVRGGPTGPLAQALNGAGIPFVVHP